MPIITMAKISGNVVAATLIACAAVFALPRSAVAADTLLFHATEPGRQTLDQGEGGGNPFASSLIELLQRPRLNLAELAGGLRTLTAKKSRGVQSADAPEPGSSANWRLLPPQTGERRIALVLVVADYRRSGGAPSLPGARHDAQRVSAALTKAGFATETALDLSASEISTKLAAFADRSKLYDAAVIYTTGHGAEVDGSIYLLPGDYPVDQKNAALADRAVRLADIARAPRAAKVNLVFYGGCRDDPFGQ